MQPGRRRILNGRAVGAGVWARGEAGARGEPGGGLRAWVGRAGYAGAGYAGAGCAGGRGGGRGIARRLRAGLGSRGVDAGEHGDGGIPIEVAVRAAGARGRGRHGARRRGPLRGGAAAGGAADAVAQQAHEGDVERKPAQLEQGRVDALRGLLREGRFGRFKRRDCSFPEGDGLSHVHRTFYMRDGVWARAFFGLEESFLGLGRDGGEAARGTGGEG
jgi:hypothetical protein